MALRKYFINIKAGESIEVGGAIVSLEKKSGSIARLLVLADESIPVVNTDQLKQARRSASLQPTGDSNGKHTL